MDIGGDVKEGRNIISGRPLQSACRCYVVNLTSKFYVERKMVGHSPLSRKGSKEGYNCNWCSGHSAGGSGKEA